MSDIVATDNLDKAYNHVYKARVSDTHNSDIWALSLDWEKRRSHIQHTLLSGKYQLSPLSSSRAPSGIYTRWSSQDAIILKAISQVLASIISITIDEKCYHVTGRGGLKAAVRNVADESGDYLYILKADVASFYSSMNHKIVLDQFATIISDKRVLSIISQSMNRVEVLDGDYSLIDKGIPRGCPLSPLVGAVMLKSLDEELPAQGFYARYMDDWVVMVKTRGELRRVVKKMHNIMHKLKLKLALDKTYIGKISKGFEFLGYRFNNKGLIGLAKKTLSNFIENILKLYEQNATSSRIQVYIHRWRQWCRAGGWERH